MKRPVRLTIFALAGLALIFAVLAFLPGGLELRATPVKGGAPLLAVPLNKKLGFTLHYFHSVNHKPIWEVHSLDQEGNIFIEEERFVSFNAGMGHWQGHGRHTQKDGLQVLEGIHQPVRRMILRIGSPGVDHTIIWTDGSLNLSQIAPGRAVEISARPISLLRSLWLKLFPVIASPMAGVEK
jgi:hypothetical protein